MSQRWLNYLYSLEVESPLFTVHRKADRTQLSNLLDETALGSGQLLLESDPGYLEQLAEQEYQLKAELARYEQEI